MKFVFKNLGPINEAELELGDLTIIAGRNNTGKTYVAYTLYGFLKIWSTSIQASELLGELDRESQSSDVALQLSNLKRLSKTVIEEGQAKWSVDRETLGRTRKVFMREIARGFSAEALPGVFSSSEKDFEDASLEVAPDEAFPEAVPSQTLHLSTEDEFTITYSNDEICIRRSKVGRKSPPSDIIRVILSDLYLSFLFPELLDPFILSTERFGISLFYKELDFTKNRLVELLQEMGKDQKRKSSRPFLVIDKMAGRYALPIRDNINYTRDIPDLQKRRSQVYDFKLFNNIESITGGHYRSSGDDIRFISKARKAPSFDIPLHIASSSARGLSDLYFFLRYVAKKNQLLIIDEPESHLDTANQIQFARLLVRAVHAGLKVLITTHSDYIVKEINNLLMLSRDFKDKPKVLKKLKYSAHDFLDPDSVRAYVAEDNSLTRCTVDRFGIDVPIFDTTIDAINRVSSELEARLTYEGEE